MGMNAFSEGNSGDSMEEGGWRQGSGSLPSGWERLREGSC